MVAHYQLVKVMELLTGESPQVGFAPDSPANGAGQPRNNAPMEEVVRLALEKNIRLRTIESCLAGTVGQAIANSPEAEQVYAGTAVVYNDTAKGKILNITNHGIFEGGWVYSQWTAETMAMFFHDGQGRQLVNSNTGQLETPDTRSPKPHTIYSANKFNGDPPQSLEINLDQNPELTRRDLKEEVKNRIAQFMAETLDKIKA
jgi:nicotinamide mononucleotide (NMN) deamidase PncC